jgi:pyruvate/oxaloacetate carboxyltransferase
MGSICGWFFCIGVILAIYQVILGRRYTWVRRGLLRMLEGQYTSMPLAQQDGLQLKVSVSTESMPQRKPLCWVIRIIDWSIERAR